MTSARSLRVFQTPLHAVPARLHRVLPGLRRRRSKLLMTLGWVSAGTGALGLGLLVGRELRQRYKFNRRTPYDVYAHSGGAYANDVEFGVGV